MTGLESRGSLIMRVDSSASMSLATARRLLQLRARSP